MRLTDAQVQEIAARITEQPLFVLGCHCHGQTATLLADWRAMRLVAEMARPFATDLDKHRRRGKANLCNWCGMGWPCDVRELANALAALHPSEPT